MFPVTCFRQHAEPLPLHMTIYNLFKPLATTPNHADGQTKRSPARLQVAVCRQEAAATQRCRGLWGMIVLLGLLLLPGFATSLNAQGLKPAAGVVFDDGALPRIDISLDPDSLEALYEDPWSDDHYRASFVFTRGAYRDSVANIGFRCRGNFSRGAAKKNFKVSFNTFEVGRKWNGLEKLNLNGQANDPSVIRAKLASDLIPQLGVEATRANHCEVYINGDFYGLYINVEHIDERFSKAHFGSQQGNMYKCIYPVDLVWQGSDPLNYDYCEWTQGGDRPPFSDLVNFIDVLNNSSEEDLPCALEEVINADDYLRQAAIDVMIGNWDGYIYNTNNLYLFHNPISDRFEYVIYDTDNTYGIDWVDRDWGTRDIYEWARTGDDRPLYERLVANPLYRDRFSWYIDRLATSLMADPAYSARTDVLKDRITPAAEADPYRTFDHGFSIDDFHDSYTESLGGHVDYGLKEFVQVRISNALAQLEAYTVSPVLNHVRHNYPVLGQEPVVTVFAEDDAPGMDVWLVYEVDGVADSVQMRDDGLHGDGLAGDRIYGAVLDPLTIAGEWAFRVHAFDADDQTAKLPCDAVSWRIDETALPLYLNEFMTANNSYMADESGAYSDWLEIYNGSNSPIYLGDKYLSDDARYPSQWRMPDMTLGPGEFAWFWADDREDSGPNHTNFKLDASGGTVGVYASETDRLRPIHVLAYGPQTPDVSSGLLPDGAGELEALVEPTPGWSNVLTGLELAHAESLLVFPNPARDRVYLGPNLCTTWVIRGMDGRLWREFPSVLSDGGWLELGGIPTGVYLLSGRCGTGVTSVKLVLK